MVVSTLGVLYASEVVGAMLTTTLAATFSPAAALSFMVFNLLSVPCMAAVATAYGEMKSARWTGFTLTFWILNAWAVSFAIFQIGTLLGY